MEKTEKHPTLAIWLGSTCDIPNFETMFKCRPEFSEMLGVKLPLETTTLETVALLADGRPMLSFGTRGHDPALAGGLTSALYSFTREIDLRKTPADGLRLDVPGGGKLVLRRANLSGREVLVSVIVRGVINEGILTLLSEFGRSLGEVLISIKDWRDISKGCFTSLFADKANIYLETLKRWRASTKMRPLVQIEFRDVIRSTLQVLGKTVNISEAFLETVSNPNLALDANGLLTLVGKELIVLTSDQELFLALNAKEDQMKVALSVAAELQGMKPQALAEAQRTFEEVKSNFVEAIAGSINGETAFFRISQRRETWSSEIIHAVYRRISKRLPHLILAHPSMGGIGSSKGLREMVAEFVETFLVEKGPYGMIKKLLSNIKAEPAMMRILTKFVDACGPNFTESAACLFARMAGPQHLKDALANLAESDALAKSFEISLVDVLTKGICAKDTPEWVDLKEKVYSIVGETYAEILEDILVGRELFVEKAKAVRGYLSGVLFSYQIVMAMNVFAEHDWKLADMRGQIPTYSDLLSTGISSQLIKKENGTIIIDGEPHLEALVSKDNLLMKRLWSNWAIVSKALEDRLASLVENQFRVNLRKLLLKYSQKVKDDLERFGSYARIVGTGGTPPPLVIEQPEPEISIYEALKDESKRIIDLIVAFYQKSASFINSSVEEISKAEGGRKVALAKEIVYTMDRIQKDYLLVPEESLSKRIDAAMDAAVKRIDSEVASLREKVAFCFRQGPQFLKYVNGELEDANSVVGSLKPPPVESFFQGGFKEILRAYSSTILGLRVPDYMVRRAVQELKDKKQVPPILKPLLKVKEANFGELVSMHLSEYIRIFTENAFSFASRHIDECYLSNIATESVTLGISPVEYLTNPIDYIGKPLGVEWTKSKETWVFKLIHPEQHRADQNPLQKVLDQQFGSILEERYGATFELLMKIGNSLSPEDGKNVENSIQRLRTSLLLGSS
jgi:hypothetical protein